MIIFNNNYLKNLSKFKIYIRLYYKETTQNNINKISSFLEMLINQFNIKSIFYNFSIKIIDYHFKSFQYNSIILP